MQTAGRSTPELDHLGALALAAGEVDVERPAQQARVEADGLRLLAHAACRSLPGPGRRRPRCRSAAAAASSECRPTPGTSTGCWRARNSPARARSQAGRPTSSRPSMVMEPGGHLGARPAHEGVGQRALARAVGPHDHVDLAAAHREVDAVQHLAPAGRGVQPARPRARARRSRQHHGHACRPRPRPRRRRPAAWPAASRARRSRRSKVLPWRGHSISHSSAHTSPSASE